MNDAEIRQLLNNQNVFIRKMSVRMRALTDANNAMAQQVHELQQRPRSITEEIDAIPGRRIDFVASGSAIFDANDLGKRGLPITIVLSQDGPFIWTHYAMALWQPSEPSTTTNLGRWRPVQSGYLPTQQVTTDFIDISYEVLDGGAQRNFQNSPRGPILSRPDNIVPLPCPTQFAPGATIQFFPTYEAITFTGSTPPTQGVLHVDFPGYRIVNL